MTAGTAGDGLAAALIQLSAHAERISGLDNREAGHHQDITARLSDLTAAVASARARVDSIGDEVSQQGTAICGLDGLENQVAALARRLASIGITDEDGGGSYQPVPAPRWWKLTGPDQQAALDRLTAWVDQIYLPSYGKLAGMLPACWKQHPLCLFTLDWLSELWSALYLAPGRDGAALAAQAEWQTRLLPAAAEQMSADATGCRHIPAILSREATTADHTRYQRP
jgi:hypothetical protein